MDTGSESDSRIPNGASVKEAVSEGDLSNFQISEPTKEKLRGKISIIMC